MSLAFCRPRWRPYLPYIAWITWRDTGILVVGTARAAAPAWRTIGNAVLANLVNPKLTLFFFAFLPQFVSPSEAAY